VAASAARQVKAVVIGISTGGPTALAHMLPMLPADLSVPVLVVQHMPTYFTSCLAKSLSKNTAIPVVEGEAGMDVTAGRIYLAPGGKHMVLRRGPKGVVLDLNEGPQVKNCRPSVDVLFTSAAEVYGANTLAIVMTGMGDDGADGAGVLKRKGARCLTQSADTCTIYGMPRALDERGLSDESLPLDRIAARIAELASSERRAA
jgi:two-component system chemotaxis response regulator CheB